MGYFSLNKFDEELAAAKAAEVEARKEYELAKRRWGLAMIEADRVERLHKEVEEKIGRTEARYAEKRTRLRSYR